jgi:hypothetical protein
VSKLYYCMYCKRVFNVDAACEYCSGNNVKELVKNSSVNIIGSKLKGKVVKVEHGKARLLIKDENNNKYIKEYDAAVIRKVL